MRRNFKLLLKLLQNYLLKFENVYAVLYDGARMRWKNIKPLMHVHLGYVWYR